MKNVSFKINGESYISLYMLFVCCIFCFCSSLFFFNSCTFGFLLFFRVGKATKSIFHLIQFIHMTAPKHNKPLANNKYFWSKKNIFYYWKNNSFYYRNKWNWFLYIHIHVFIFSFFTKENIHIFYSIRIKNKAFGIKISLNRMNLESFKPYYNVSQYISYGCR